MGQDASVARDVTDFSETPLGPLHEAGLPCRTLVLVVTSCGEKAHRVARDATVSAPHLSFSRFALSLLHASCMTGPADGQEQFSGSIPNVSMHL